MYRNRTVGIKEQKIGLFHPASVWLWIILSSCRYGTLVLMLTGQQQQYYHVINYNNIVHYIYFITYMIRYL